MLQFAVAGYPVKLVDCSEELLKRGMEHIRADAEEFAQAGLLRAEDTVADACHQIEGRINHFRRSVFAGHHFD